MGGVFSVLDNLKLGRALLRREQSFPSTFEHVPRT